MAKQQSYQKYVLKIHSSKILKNKKNLNISLPEMRKNKEIVALADSQVLRFIDEINKVNNIEVEKQILSIRNEIKKKQQEIKTVNSTQIKNIKFDIKKLYSQLDDIQNKPDYLCVVMDKNNDIDKLDNGFKINGLNYKRLVGTSNGIKKSTVVYVSEVSNSGARIFDELQVRLENGRNTNIPLVPAKYEAYKSLACSASIPVTNPNGILVVDDLVVKFNADILEIDDGDVENQNVYPTIERKFTEIELNNSDGYGLILPSLAKKWSGDLKLEYILDGCCIRNAFLKGMMFPFDFRDFANKIAHKEYVVDVWGQQRNINEVEMILTTSMLKLWDSYNSLEDYLSNCESNGYTFAITKVCPETLDEERTLNYQFIQSYNLTDDQIEELVAPTVVELQDVIGGDINKAILFLRGTSVNENNVEFAQNDFVKALMIDDRLFNDPYVINSINNLIRCRIKEAKIGVVKVKGNYAVISGDPYALCQHIFKTNVDENGNDIVEEMGLLKANEIYSKFWVDKQVDRVVCFRAPMSCHNNIRAVNVVHNEDTDYWYQYMDTVNIVNCHDAMAHSMNGFDNDGDILFTTDNNILLDNWKDTPAILCVQRKAEKKIISDGLLRISNKNGFGDEIGVTTNHITAMFDVMCEFSEDSKEYKELEYRIQCGQLYQQNAIDRVKGIVCKPMPKEWFTRINVGELIRNNATENEINKANYLNSICAYRKPYFMNYIYPQQKAKYDKYIKKTNKKCIEEFKTDIATLTQKENKTEKERLFLKNFIDYLPSSDNSCVMNRLCHIVEKHFDGYVSELKANSDFDYTILKSDVVYSKSNYAKIKALYKQYNEDVLQYTQTYKQNHIDDDEKNTYFRCLTKYYKDECVKQCPDLDELCNIVLDLCYKNTNTKRFAWDMCGTQIINNLLKCNNYTISYLTLNPDGNVEYCGQKFSKERKYIGGNNETYSE